MVTILSDNLSLKQCLLDNQNECLLTIATCSYSYLKWDGHSHSWKPHKENFGFQTCIAFYMYAVLIVRLDH